MALVVQRNSTANTSLTLLCDNTTIKTKELQMKLTKITLSLALLGALTLGMAAEDNNSTTEDQPTVKESIDAQIANIKSASAAERVKLMNQFKEKLATMNLEDRTAAISAMQTKINGNVQAGATSVTDTTKATSAMIQTRAQQQSQEMQSQSNAQMTQYQTMMQGQADNMKTQGNNVNPFK